jgi:hypothetical protein
MKHRSLNVLALVVLFLLVVWACGGSSEEAAVGSAAGGGDQAQVANASGGAQAADAAVSQEGSSGGVPDIEFEELSYDFGTVSGGAKLKHTFVLRNTGTADLEIKKVKGG